MSTTPDPRPVFDLPRLPDALRIDGDCTDWGSAGLRIAAFAEGAAPPIAPGLLSCELRLGWNADGLVVALRVRCSLPWVETADAHLAFNADSVELFLRRGSEWKDLVQMVIAPGMAPGQDALRHSMYDYRGPIADWAGLATTGEAARQRHADGFSLEVILPWSQLRLTVADGMTCEFAFKFNKQIPGQSRRQLTWSGPTGDMFQRLRLAGPGAQTVERAAWLARDGVDRLAVCAVGPAADAGSVLTLARDNRELLRLTQQPDGGRAVACAIIPMPPPAGASLVLTRDGQPASRLAPPDVALELSRNLEGASTRARWWVGVPLAERLRFRVPALLTGPELPQPACPDPALAETAGVIAIETRWFAANRTPVTRAERPGRYGAVITVRCASGETVVFHQTCVRLPDALPAADLADDALRRLGAGPPAADDLGSRLVRDRLGRQLADRLVDEDETAELLAGLLDSATDGQPARAIARDRTWWHTLRSGLGTATAYRWFRSLPRDYDRDAARRWPAVIYLHGSSGLLPRDYKPFEQRDSAIDLLAWSKDKDLPLAIYALQTSAAWEPPAVLAALDRILAEDRIDPDRVVLMGFSMGAIGTWDCIIDHPERFAAAVPIGGRGYRAGDVAGIAGRLPVWTFNGDKDLTTTLEDAQVVVAALRAAGGEVRLTVLPGAGHGESQDDTFNTPGLWPWVLERRRKAPVSGLNTPPPSP